MGLFNRKEDVVEAAPPEQIESNAGKPFTGDPRFVIFREGWYYPVSFDSNGNEFGPDLSQPLVFRDGGYHHARPAEPNHFHTYGVNAAELLPGAE